MDATGAPRVKICCIADLDEARLAIGMGAHAIGLVSAMPSGPGVIDEETIAAVAREVPSSTATFLLTSLQRVEEIGSPVRVRYPQAQRYRNFRS